MEITEVRIKLMEEPNERLRAFCSMTFDHSFVVRDLKIIDGTTGLFVAMPSRKLMTHCPRCRCKNPFRASYCNQCGGRLVENVPPPRDESGRVKLYADIAHPINAQCREMIQQRGIAAFQEELIRSQEPGYVSSYDDFPACEDDTSFLTDQRIEAATHPNNMPSRPPSSAIRQCETRKEDEGYHVFGAGIFD